MLLLDKERKTHLGEGTGIKEEGVLSELGDLTALIPREGLSVVMRVLALRTAIRQLSELPEMRRLMAVSRDITKDMSAAFFPRLDRFTGPNSALGKYALYVTLAGVQYGRYFQCEESPYPFDGISSERIPLSQALLWTRAGMGPIDVRQDTLEAAGRLQKIIDRLSIMDPAYYPDPRDEDDRFFLRG